jgi:hypothetical protein
MVGRPPAVETGPHLCTAIEQGCAKKLALIVVQHYSRDARNGVKNRVHG